MLSDDEERFLSLLPQDGNAIGNITLQRLLGWDDARYAAAKVRLRHRGLISLGKGQGGSVRLVEADRFTLLEQLPPNGARITINKLKQRLGWKDTRFDHVVSTLVDDGLLELGPRNTISIVLTPEVEEWLLRCVLPENPASAFDVQAVVVQLGWTEEDVWRVRARIIEQEQREQVSIGQGNGARETTGSKEKATKATTRTEGPLRNDPGEPVAALEIFVAYARADEARREKLYKHLSALRRSKDIEDWSDQQILAGQEWPRAKREKLDRADIALLLVSAEFLHSDDCYRGEMMRALERHEAGDTVVIPIILCPCDWESTPLAKLRALPGGNKPISLWSNEDEAFLDVVQGIRRVVQDRKKRVANGGTGNTRRAR